MTGAAWVCYAAHMVNLVQPAGFSLNGRRALITGAARGLGCVMAGALATAGAEVWLNGRNAAPLDDAVSQIRASGASAHAAAFDVTDPAAVTGWLADAPEMDILINNATLRQRAPTADLSADDVQMLLDVNALAAYRLTRALTPAMLAKGRGAIVNVTSLAGPLAGPADPGYTLAKGALAAMTRAHAVEFGGRGIRVNAIAPGFFATEANETWVANNAIADFLKVRNPMGRWGEPHEIAGAVVFLCSDAASYINGHTLVVDGGMSVKM
ncbi:MAG: SDR family oxidoreductase [Pseudomonadota bacterium]